LVPTDQTCVVPDAPPGSPLRKSKKYVPGVKRMTLWLHDADVSAFSGVTSV
jgi:hypothetical protein